MPKLNGVFENFPDLEIIPPEDVNKWLKNKLDPQYILNYIGNLLLYPQVIPVRKQDLEIDLAILRELVKRKPNFCFDSNKKIVTIPQIFAQRFPNLPALVLSLVEVLNLEDVNKVYLEGIRKNERVLLATVMAPKLKIAQISLEVTINQNKKNFPLGTISLLPLISRHFLFNIPNHPPIDIEGGKLGIVLDLRRIEK
jgi:hypothetical protein